MERDHLLVGLSDRSRWGNGCKLEQKKKVVIVLFRIEMGWLISINQRSVSYGKSGNMQLGRNHIYSRNEHQ